MVYFSKTTNTKLLTAVDTSAQIQQHRMTAHLDTVPSPQSSLQSISPDSPEPEFVQVDEKYHCPACQRVLRQALQTVCGHRICEPCLDELLQTSTPAECPVKENGCQYLSKTNNTVFKDMCARKEIRQLPVYCTFKSHGCTQTPRWAELGQHVMKCDYSEIPCPYASWGCTTLISKRDLESHRQSCEYRPESCQNCGMEVPQIHMQSHIKDKCMAVVLPCPYMCGEQAVPRGEMEKHQASCVAKPLDCRLKMLGCQFQGTESQLQKHMQEQMERHVDLISMRTVELDLKNMAARRENQETTNEMDLLRNQLKQALQEKGGLQQIVDQQERKIRECQKTISNQANRIARLEEAQTHLAREDTVQLQAAQIKDIQDTQSNYETRLSHMENVRSQNVLGKQNGLRSDDVVRTLNEHENQLAMYNIRLAETDLRFKVLETASFDSVIIWKITEYSRRKREAESGRTLSLYSQPFYTGRYGYKMCVRVYLNGDGMGKDTHMSLFFVLLKGEYDTLLPWPFKQKVTLQVLDQSPAKQHLSDTFRPDPASTSFQQPTSEMNVGSGCPLFVAQSVLENRAYSYLKNDTLYIKCVVDKTGLYEP